MAVPVACRDHVAEHLVQPGRREVEVDETRARDLDALDVAGRGGLEGRDDAARSLTGLEPGGLGDLEGHVGRPVAVLALFGRPEVDAARGHGETGGVERRRAGRRRADRGSREPRIPTGAPTGAGRASYFGGRRRPRWFCVRKPLEGVRPSAVRGTRRPPVSFCGQGVTRPTSGRRRVAPPGAPRASGQGVGGEGVGGGTGRGRDDEGAGERSGRARARAPGGRRAVPTRGPDAASPAGRVTGETGGSGETGEPGGSGVPGGAASGSLAGQHGLALAYSVLERLVASTDSPGPPSSSTTPISVRRSCSTGSTHSTTADVALFDALAARATRNRGCTPSRRLRSSTPAPSDVELAVALVETALRVAVLDRRRRPARGRRPPGAGRPPAPGRRRGRRGHRQRSGAGARGPHGRRAATRRWTWPGRSSTSPRRSSTAPSPWRSCATGRRPTARRTGGNDLSRRSGRNPTRLVAVTNAFETQEMEVHLRRGGVRTIGRAPAAHGLTGAVEATFVGAGRDEWRPRTIELDWARTIETTSQRQFLVAVALRDRRRRHPLRTGRRRHTHRRGGAGDAQRARLLNRRPSNSWPWSSLLSNYFPSNWARRFAAAAAKPS